jgi:phospho-N-acetylmuramoyl-pentapeptide-transferase
VIALLIAGTVAGAISLLATPLFIRWLQENGIGQQIRKDGPRGHHTKAGTPTMGGVCIVIAALVGYAVAHFWQGTVYTRKGLLIVFIIAACALIGFADDYIKIRNGRSLGLTAKQKFAAQFGTAIAFSVLAVYWAKVDTHLSFTRYNLPGIDLHPIGWIVLATLFVVGFSNAVNLTDGLDGLAAGPSSFAYSAYAAIGFWQLRHPEYHVVQSLDPALISLAMACACIGFLWWNANPARIFMGDTGSLSIGAGIAAMALMTNTQMLLFLIGGIFVIETASVMLQVGTFRLFNKKRLFRMAPIHHHFELLGWPETHVIIRFWILSGIFTALALGIFYADFLSLHLVDKAS